MSNLAPSTAAEVCVSKPTAAPTVEVVFGSNANEARAVAEEVARKAYWNSSYFGGSFEDLASIAEQRPTTVR